MGIRKKTRNQDKYGLALHLERHIGTSIPSSSTRIDSNKTAEQRILTSIRAFAPTTSLFVKPESYGGYGVYEEHGYTFAPGEDIELYLEPVGYSYSTIESNIPNGKTQYLMEFTAVVISDTSGNILGGFQKLQISKIVSHHQNKEINLNITLSQSEPFPDGDYKVEYTVHDEPSGNTFKIIKDVTISASTSGQPQF